MKKVLVLMMIAAGLTSMVSCTDGEVAAGAGGVAVGIGIGRGYGNGNGYGHPHRPPPRRCDRWGCNYDQTVALDTTALDTADNTDLTARYNISDDAAIKIKQAFAGTNTQGLNSFQSIGLTSADLKSFMNHTLPSQDAVKAFSEKLDMSQAQGRDLMVSMMTEFQSQAADGNSEYWKTCTAKATWKTNENMSCKNASWSGCSPATGAEYCY